MSTIADIGFPNLVNIMKRMNPDGSVADVANILSKKLALLDDVPWEESNQTTGHRITQATALPSPGFRKLNAGVDAHKGETAQFDETCGIMEDYNAVDVDVAKISGNAAKYRAEEDKLFIEGYSQAVATAIFYESAATNPERIHGLTPRFGATTGYTASSYVKTKGTVSGTNAQSLWLINWEPRKVYGIFPKGTMAGLLREDKGEQWITDANSKKFWAFVTKFQWKFGIAVEDYRYAMRYQWDPDDGTVHPDSAKSLYLMLQEMLSTVQDVGGNARFYMSRTSKIKLDAQLASNDANFLTYIDAGGRRVPTFEGIPIRVTDALVGETAIS